MAESEGAFRLTFVQGRGLLSLAGRDFEGLGHVDSLELEIPNLRFPFDLSGGVARFKNRRLHLRELSLFVGSRELSGFLARAPLADFGIFNPRVSIEGTRLTLCARVVLGGREVEVTALAAIAPCVPRSASLCIYGVRCYGFLPIPAPLVVTALFSALGAESPANRDASADQSLPSLIQVRSAAEVRIDVCELAMLAILPMHGWRLPRRSQVQIRVAGGAAQTTRIPFVFAEVDPMATADPLLGEDVIPAVLAMRDFANRAQPIEEALARGDIGSALVQLRALGPLDAGDKVGTRRLLQVLVAAQDTLSEAGEVAQAALARWPNFAPAVLALAVLASERGQPEAAAGFYERLAELSAAQGRADDESCALLAAARQCARGGETDRALTLLARALGHRLRPVARARIMRRAGAGDWEEILAAIADESAADAPEVRDEVIEGLELLRQGSSAKDAALIAQAADALEAIFARGQWPESAVSRSEAAYEMGMVRLSLSDDEAASQWLAACIEGDAPGPIAAAAWRALAELLHRRGELAQEVQALVGWASDGRVPETATEKVRHLVEAAAIAAHHLAAPSEAASYLEMGLMLSPADGSVLSALEQLAQQTGDPTTVAAILRRHLRDSRPDQGKAVLRLLIRLLAERDDRPDELEAAKDACAVLLELSPDDEEAAFFQARLAWKAGDRRTAAKGYLGAIQATTLTPQQVAEARLRTAQVLLAEGQQGEAVLHLALGLAFEPKGARLDVLTEALHAFGEDEKLASLLAQREAVPGDDKSDFAIKQSLAEAAESRGDWSEAEILYRNLHEAAPAEVEWLERLASLCRRQSRGEDLRGWLEKLWTLVDGDGLPPSRPVDVVAVGLELSELWARDAGGKARAEAILRRLSEIAPPSMKLLDLLHGVLLDRGDFDEAAKVFAPRLSLTPTDEVAAFLLSRTRMCLARPDGQKPALAMLQGFAVDALDDEALGLRADLAERAGDVMDAVLCLEHMRGRVKESERAGLTQRLAELAARPATAKELSVNILERLQAELPDNLFLAKALFEAYGRLSASDRNRAWQELLAKVPALPDSYRARLQIALCEAAEQEGDVQSAEQMLASAIKLDSSPEARAEQQVAHARLLIARGDIAQAEDNLREALSIKSDSAAALALTAELAYRAQEWERARQAYVLLAKAPGASAAVPAKLLALRRAELSEMFGDHAEAEAAYRQVIALDPRDDGAREALAGFALARGELSEAALHLQEVVRLLPKDAVDRLTRARQHLGQVYLGLGDLQAARQNLELSLASDPDRPSTLELLTATYEKVGLFREAAAMCERLSRVLSDPAKKAEALYRKGEILRVSLDDGESATDAYLRASDLDPSFAPNLARLVCFYWSRGDLASIVDVGPDLLQAGPSPKVDRQDVGLLVAIAALLAKGDEALAQSALESPLLGGPVGADLAAMRLAELVGRVARGKVASLDRVLNFVCSTIRGGFEGELRGAAFRAATAESADPAVCMLLGRLFQRRGQAALARSAYSVAHFIDPSLGAGQALADLGDETKPRAEAFAPGSGAVHPSAEGPLRRVLQHLAVALVTPGIPAEVASESLQPETVAVCEKLQRDLSAPTIPFVSHGEGSDVTLSATQPLRVLIGRRAEALAPEDLRFFVARALEQARAGTLALLRMSQENLQGMLQAVLRIAGAPGTPFDIAGESADASTALWLERLRQPDIAALIPLGQFKDDLLENARQALANPPEIEAYIRGCRYTADRVGLLASGKPLAVLRALSGSVKDAGGSVDTTSVVHRQELMRGSQALRELVAFMLSEEYASLVVAA
jgi:tetratricopeptide (TPR) repeat protein